ncbi:hypothetical protein BGZ97_005218, partial [Linnemannia gamsii]
MVGKSNAPVAAPAVTKEETAPSAVEAAATPEVAKEAEPVATEAPAAEAEQTFSTAVEPSENPVLNGDGTPLEAAAATEDTSAAIVV